MGGSRGLCTFAICAILAVVGIGACEKPNTYAPPPPPEVTVAKPVRDVVVIYREFPGRTAPAESVELRARVTGVLEAVLFEEGEPVERGAPLYEIERAPYEAALEAAKAQLARAEATLAEAKYDLDKVRELQSSGAAGQQELVIAQAKYDSALADRQAAAAEVTRAELDLGYTRIAAPISGRINQSRVDVGNLVGQNEPTPLTTIVPWDPIHVYVTIGERDVLEWRRRVVERGRRDRDDMKVYLRLADGTDYPIAGQVDYVDNRVDPQTGTIRVRAVFENPDKILVPGIFARVRVPNPPREALLVPEVALQRDLAGYYLLVVGDDDVVDRRNVEVAERVGDARVVTDGLEENVDVIINGLQRARPGAKVDPQLGTFAPTLVAGDDGGAGQLSTQPAATQASGAK